MLLSNQERNLEEKEYHAIIEKLKQKKQMQPIELEYVQLLLDLRELYHKQLG